MNTTSNVNIKKYEVKVPNNILLLYDSQKNMVLLKKSKKTKVLQTKLKLLINKRLSKLLITKSFSSKISNKYKNKFKIFQGLILSEIKQILFELTTEIYYQRLRFVGIGYRAISFNPKKSSNNNVFLLKLGISHPLYLNTNINIRFNCLKFTKLFIYGNDYQKICQVTANIRLKKSPEPYKGKGILFNNEKIKLKKGKKI